MKRCGSREAAPITPYGSPLPLIRITAALLHSHLLLELGLLEALSRCPCRPPRWTHRWPARSRTASGGRRARSPSDQLLLDAGTRRPGEARRRSASGLKTTPYSISSTSATIRQRLPAELVDVGSLDGELAEARHLHLLASLEPARSPRCATGRRPSRRVRCAAGSGCGPPRRPSGRRRPSRTARSRRGEGRPRRRRPRRRRPPGPRVRPRRSSEAGTTRAANRNGRTSSSMYGLSDPPSSPAMVAISRMSATDQPTKKSSE